MKSTRYADLALLLLATAMTTCGQDEQTQGIAAVWPPTDRQFFDGPGQLATIWSRGPDVPIGERALILTSASQNTFVNVSAPWHVRWRTPTEIIVEQEKQATQNSIGRRILRFTSDGAFIDELYDGSDLAKLEPSPDGLWAAIDRYDMRTGLDGVQISNFQNLSESLILHPQPSGVAGGSISSGIVWSPDAKRFAVAMGFPKSDRGGRLILRIAVASREEVGFSRLGSEDDSGPGGMVPIFWLETGIYAASKSIGGAFLQCDASGSGCEPIYFPGADRTVLSGQPLGADQALLLVKDFTVDPFEIRAKEIHEVNLTTGEGRILIRTRDNEFISDLDWIASTSD